MPPTSTAPRAQVLAVADARDALHHVQAAEACLRDPVAACAQALLVESDTAFTGIHVIRVDLGFAGSQSEREARAVVA